MQYDKQYLIDLLGEWQIKANEENWQKKGQINKRNFKRFKQMCRKF